MGWKAAVLALSLMSGCSSPPGESPQAENVAAAECIAPPQILDARATGHFVNAFNRSTAGGLYLDFGWTRDPVNLLRVELMTEWRPTDPTAAELRVRADVLETVGYFDQPSHQGASPLILLIDFNQTEALAKPRLYFGSTEDHSGPAYASKTLLEQQLTVTVTETYRCLDTVHP